MTLVLLPGMDGSGELFANFVAALPALVPTRVIRYPDDAKLSYAQLGEAVRSRLPDSPYVLLAESFSSPLAIRIAATAPKDLRGIVICAGFIEAPVAWPVGKLLYWAAPALFRVPPPDFVIRQWMLSGDASSELVRKVRDVMISARPGVLVDRMRAVLRCQAAADLRRLRLPILYIAATEDRLIGERGLAQFKRARPDATVISIHGPHLILQSKPAEAALAVANFVQRIL